MFKIGVITDSFKLPLLQAIDYAARIGAQGIQVYATEGEMAPENMTASKLNEVMDRIRSNGLVISALCGDLGGHGFMVREENDWRIEKSKRIIDLALEMNTTIVTTHIGVIPQDKNHERRRIMHLACAQLSEYAQSVGATFAVETGPETAIVLKDFLDELPAKGVGVNMDPANLVMVSGDDSTQAVFTLKDYIVHTHAKDGKMLKKADTEQLYCNFTEEIIDRKGYYQETPLGMGSVDFDQYLSALRDIGYDGFLTIEREVGNQPIEDITMAVEFLKQKINA